MNRPTVSIGLPVYNGERFIGQALDSILSQDFDDFELIISDNASTDSTGGVCESYSKRDKRIRYFRNETNIGVNPNHDRVFELSEGKYFAWAAHDVELLPGMLRRCLEEMTNASGSVVLVYPRCEMIYDGRTITSNEQDSIEDSDPRPYRRMATVIGRIQMVNQLYGLIDTEALGKTRLNGPYASSDYVLLAELAMLGEIWEIPEILIRRRIDSNRGTAAVYSDQKAWQAWLDPRIGGRALWLPTRERLALEYLRSAWRLPLNPADKLMCMVVGSCFQYWRDLLRVTGPWRHKLRRMTGRRGAFR